MNWHACIVGIAVTAFALEACTNGTPVSPEITAAAKSGRLFAVSKEQAAFYRYGPQQGNGPDQRLQRDTVLALIRPSFGYSKVQLLTGEQGYVASEDIHLASKELIATTIAPPPSVAQNRSRHFRLDSNDPRLIAPPEQLPLDLPEPTPLPGTERTP